MDSNFNNLSCQLGGLRLNGNHSAGTAKSITVLTIDDPGSIVTASPSLTGKYLRVCISGVNYLLPLYQ